jgi:hypothetical protein
MRKSRSLGLNTHAASMFKTLGVESCYVYWDPTGRALGIRPCKVRDNASYVISFHPRNGSATISAYHLFDRIRWTAETSVRLQANWDSHQKMLVVRVPQGHIASDKDVN